MARGTNLELARQLSIVEDLDGFACMLIDRDGSKKLQKNTMFFHLGMMALFITVILAVPAWIAALLNILLTAQLACWRLRCTAHGVELQRFYTRGDPGIAAARGEQKGKGPLPLGLGQPEPATFLPFSEMARVESSYNILRFHMVDGQVEELRLELTDRADVAHLGDRIREVLEGYSAGVSVTREQADRDRERLVAMARASRTVQH